MRYTIVHLSEYSYSTPASLSLNEACLVPRETAFQTVRESVITVEPKADFQRDRFDWYGNRWRFYSFEHPHGRLSLTAKHEVEVLRAPGQGDGSVFGWEPFLAPSPFVRINAEFAEYGRHSMFSGVPLTDVLVAINQRIFRDFTYDPKATEVSTPIEEFFRERRGVCQDYAHLGVAILRSLGIPARYVSGYLNTLPPPGKEKVLGADASHAWVSAWVAGQGWIDFDPTNGVLVGSDHVALAWGRDYGDVSPFKGVVLGGGHQSLSVEVSVIPRAEVRP